MNLERVGTNRSCRGLSVFDCSPLSSLAPIGDIIDSMKRATMTLPDDLAKALDRYLASQEAPPSLTTVVQAALRQYLSERGFLRTRKTLEITPAGKGSGRSDASQHHDRYLARRQK
jgi:hypothetical protein